MIYYNQIPYSIKSSVNKIIANKLIKKKNRWRKEMERKERIRKKMISVEEGVHFDTLFLP